MSSSTPAKMQSAQPEATLSEAPAAQSCAADRQASLLAPEGPQSADEEEGGYQKGNFRMYTTDPTALEKKREIDPNQSWLMQIMYQKLTQSITVELERLLRSHHKKFESEEAAPRSGKAPSARGPRLYAGKKVTKRYKIRERFRLRTAFAVNKKYSANS